ncbi:hypothetical protein EXW72_07250 [Pseudomonas sp. BCA14]|uniref:SMI1/KNR4 family protein n=1 Tax=unclassified Pseudomonas TaxID=196821 RepID=UPI00106E6F2F|nr:hypothetical protein EXW70_05240 [Pseudomonas sp. JMN1]TFF15388.1 hypothetical protein EXW71_03800 [Pseudomonas sp. BCA17]TFF31795.1 hypothetical protein EXW72_07250 [Pseudomonas sp. BCA14]TFF32747.1 hypothetical protein EXW73_03050 [Pseudomonas sp. BCA13]
MEPNQRGVSVKLNSDWIGNEGASIEALNALRAAAPRDLPFEYYQLLTYSNGGEGPLTYPLFNFCLDPAETASDASQIALFEEIASGLFVFGGDGGGQLFAFDLRGAAPWPIVRFDGVDPRGSMFTVAARFSEFAKLISWSRPS